MFPSIDVTALNAKLDFFSITDVNGEVLVSQAATIVRSTSVEVTAIRLSQCSQMVLGGSVSELDIEIAQGNC